MAAELPGDADDDALAQMAAPLHALMQRDEAGRTQFAAFVESTGLPANRILEIAEGVPHRVLNAETHAQEAEILSAAGQRNQVTVATQMAGRGVDIPLGEGVEELGGLRVVGIEHKTNPRKDDQARGRAGRQGKPGSSQFYVSPSDEVFTFLPAHRMRKLCEMLPTNQIDPDDKAIQSAWNKAVDHAQERAEIHQEMVRRLNVKYDGIIQAQRKYFMARRDELLEDDQLGDLVQSWLHNHIDEQVATEVLGETPPEDWKKRDLERFAAKQEKAGTVVSAALVSKVLAAIEPGATASRAMSVSELHDLVDERVGERVGSVMRARSESPTDFNQYLRDMILFNMDETWIDYLQEMEWRKGFAHLEAYREVDPFTEYSKLASNAFMKMSTRLENTIAERFCHHLLTGTNTDTQAETAPAT